MPPAGLLTSTMYMTKGSITLVKRDKIGIKIIGLPQLAVRAINDGVFDRDRSPIPISGAPSDPLKDALDPDTQRYFVDTV